MGNSNLIEIEIELFEVPSLKLLIEPILRKGSINYSLLDTNIAEKGRCRRSVAWTSRISNELLCLPQGIKGSFKEIVSRITSSAVLIQQSRNRRFECNTFRQGAFTTILLYLIEDVYLQAVIYVLQLTSLGRSVFYLDALYSGREDLDLLKWLFLSDVISHLASSLWRTQPGRTFYWYAKSCYSGGLLPVSGDVSRVFTCRPKQSRIWSKVEDRNYS